MQIGMVGLGRMGSSMVRRLMKGGHDCVVHDTMPAAGEVVVDGGNSYYRDDLSRAKRLAERGLHYVDCGTSGGIAGLERGYCLMIGGDPEVVHRLEPIFATLAPGEGSTAQTPG